MTTDPATNPTTDPTADPIRDPATDPMTKPTTEPSTQPTTTTRGPALARQHGAVGPSGLPVFGWLLRQQRRSLVLWSVSVAAVSGIYASFYAVMDGDELQALVQGMPEGLVTALGYDQLASAEGYLESTVFALLAPILLLVFGLGLAARVLAGVEEDGTLELEMTHPVSRRRVVLERYLAVVVQLAVLVVALTLVVISIAAVQDMGIPLGNLLAASLGLFLLVLALSGVTFAVGAATGRRSLALGAGAGVAVLAYLADALAPFLDEPGRLQAASPFSWYLAAEPLTNGIGWLGYSGLALVAVLSLGVALVAFARRDLGV